MIKKRVCMCGENVYSASSEEIWRCPWCDSVVDRSTEKVADVKDRNRMIDRDISTRQEKKRREN